MSNENDMNNFFNTLFPGFNTPVYSESDIISMYIDGKISKEEFIERMDNARRR